MVGSQRLVPKLRSQFQTTGTAGHAKRERGSDAIESCEDGNRSAEAKEYDASPLKTLHDSWEEWEKYRATYQVEHNTRIVVNETENVKKKAEQAAAADEAVQKREVTTIASR
ncbi:hypothetical protein GQ600_1162 [Phytophthora cactorum]|nr:hypothetical protein GQ600_1162 [Phytophthora cactorum]